MGNFIFTFVLCVALTPVVTAEENFSFKGESGVYLSFLDAEMGIMHGSGGYLGATIAGIGAIGIGIGETNQNRALDVTMVKATLFAEPILRDRTSVSLALVGEYYKTEGTWFWGTDSYYGGGGVINVTVPFARALFLQPNIRVMYYPGDDRESTYLLAGGMNFFMKPSIVGVGIGVRGGLFGRDGDTGGVLSFSAGISITPFMIPRRQ